MAVTSLSSTRSLEPPGYDGGNIITASDCIIMELRYVHVLYVHEPLSKFWTLHHQTWHGYSVDHWGDSKQGVIGKQK